MVRGNKDILHKAALIMALPDEKKSAFLNLDSSCHCDEIICTKPLFYKIWTTNGFVLPDDVSDIVDHRQSIDNNDDRYVYELASWVNRAHLSNMTTTFSKEAFIIFTAATDIKKGDSLTIPHQAKTLMPPSLPTPDEGFAHIVNKVTLEQTKAISQVDAWIKDLGTQEVDMKVRAMRRENSGEADTTLSPNMLVDYEQLIRNENKFGIPEEIISWYISLKKKQLAWALTLVKMERPLHENKAPKVADSIPPTHEKLLPDTANSKPQTQEDSAPGVADSV